MTQSLTLADLQTMAAGLSAARDELDDSIRSLQNQIQAIKTPLLPAIRARARRVASLHRALAAAIEANPGLFAKPRTFIVEGLRFGMYKGAPDFDWDDDAALCVRIRLAVASGLLTAEQAELLIAKSEKPVTAAIKQLPPDLLVAIGVDFSAAGDAPMIKSVDDGVEKAVNSMIKDAVKNLDAVEG